MPITAQFTAKQRQDTKPLRANPEVMSQASRARVGKAVVISSCAPRDWVFIAELRKQIPELHVVHTVSSPAAEPEDPARNSGKRARESILMRLERLHTRLHAPAEARDIMNKVPNVTVEENQLNSSRGEELIRELGPDLLIACHTCLIKPRIYELAPLAINIHFGLAPAYRGNHTLFWALFNGDPDGVAITIHRLAAGIDNGNIYGIVRPKMRPWNSESVLALRMATDVVKVVSRLADLLHEDGKPPPGTSQAEKGKLYLARHRTLQKDLEYLLYRRWRYLFRRFGERSLRYFF